MMLVDSIDAAAVNNGVGALTHVNLGVRFVSFDADHSEPALRELIVFFHDDA